MGRTFADKRRAGLHEDRLWKREWWREEVVSAAGLHGDGENVGLGAEAPPERWSVASPPIATGTPGSAKRGVARPQAGQRTRLLGSSSDGGSARFES